MYISWVFRTAKCVLRCLYFRGPEWFSLKLREMFFLLVFFLSQFCVSLAVPGLVLAVIGKYIPTLAVLYILGR